MDTVTINPKEITHDADTDQQIASFGYYDGIQYAKDHSLQFTTSFRDVFKGTHYIVCCGDVMIAVQPTDFPDIPRRTI